MRQVDKSRRRLLIAATGIAGGVGMAGAAVPFIASMFPSERAKAAGAPVLADIRELAPGALRIVAWRGKPVWILRRTEAMLADIRADDALVSDPHSDVPQQPDYARNEFRSIKPTIAVLVGVCTHLGCSPQFRSAEEKAQMGQGWNGGFFCPCHGSKFDLAGRVLRGSPAPTNLVVPPYAFLSDDKIIIGSDVKPA
ncbi:MAG: ubiquinol-cytochrome c reductase iron-sulfur subunit [Burkholderiales bacterium]